MCLRHIFRNVEFGIGKELIIIVAAFFFVPLYSFPFPWFGASRF